MNLNFQKRIENNLDLVMSQKEAEAKKLITRRESTQFTYLYTATGNKIRSSAAVIE